MYNNLDIMDYGLPQTSSALSGWMIASVILSIVGAILVLLLFLKKGNKNKFKGFIKLLYDFLNFDLLTLEIAIKALYVGLAILVVLSSFSLISISFISFLVYLIVGSIVLRLSFELIVMMIKICNNTSEINKKLK